MTNAWDDDTEFMDRTVASVSDDSVTWDDGWSFWIKSGGPVVPEVGMKARLFGRGLGYPVRGLILDGVCVFYRTQADWEVHNKQQLYGVDCEDLLKRWDDGQGVWSVELGGIGPGYEQCIQITGFEILRALLDEKPGIDIWQEEDRGPWEKLSKRISERVDPIVGPLGLSGAQWGAAMNLATVFYRNGPVGAMELVDGQRRIQVNKNFPTLGEAS